MEGIDFFETFSAVVNWTTVRLMLILSFILGIATKQVLILSCMLRLMVPPAGMIQARKKRRDKKFMFACLNDSPKQESIKAKMSLYTY